MTSNHVWIKSRSPNWLIPMLMIWWMIMTQLWQEYSKPSLRRKPKCTMINHVHPDSVMKSVNTERRSENLSADTKPTQLKLTNRSCVSKDLNTTGVSMTFGPHTIGHESMRTEELKVLLKTRINNTLRRHWRDDLWQVSASKNASIVWWSNDLPSCSPNFFVIKSLSLGNDWLSLILNVLLLNSFTLSLILSLV